ncbi:MAG: hypothetical protein IKY67_06595 [Paludibacteraceae bacterium]|nr:hypothetical protein [Paludibacteraceae bacterium]
MAHTIYENVVLSNKINDILTTQVNLNNYMTIDNSLAEGAGMKKVINTYTSTGAVEELGMGEGNTGSIEVSFTPVEYEVKTYQGKFAFYDEQEMTDPMVVDTGLKHSADAMINTFVDNAIAEYEKATLKETVGAWSFDAIADAIAKMNLEDEAGLFLLISPADKAAFRKALKDDLKYAEGYVRTGYIGTVCGVPVIVTKAVEAGKGYLATKEAVTVFIKKDTETEYERDADVRNNSYWVRKVAVVALTDATKVVKIVIGA